MKNLNIINLFFLISILSACSQSKSTFDFDQQTNFNALKTYQLDHQSSTVFAEANPLIHKRITDVIISNLQVKKLTPSETPDFIISYSINYKKALSGNTLGTQVEIAIRSYQQGHISLSSGEQLKQTLNGTLNINVFSSPNRALLWRATSAELISDEDNLPAEAYQRINEIVNEMLSHFPATGT